MFIQRSQNMTAFSIVLFGQMISILGSSMTSFALTIWAWQTTGEVTALALVTFFRLVPRVLFTPFAGALVDRWNKKPVMMFSDLAAGLASIMILILFNGGQLQIWKVRGADGSDLQQMTDGGSIAAWAPDSRRLATARAFPSKERVAMVFDAGLTATEQRPELLPAPDQALRTFIPISWSPDGTRLAGQLGFSDRGGAGIVLFWFASKTYDRLTDFGEWPAWFGDSRRIIFVFKGKEFWVADARTKQTKKVYSTVWDVLGPPRLTRDSRVAYFSRRVTQSDIYLLSFE